MSHWLDACLASKNRIAIRETETHILKRHWHGDCIIRPKKSIMWRDATERESEGYLDWKPEE